MPNKAWLITGANKGLGLGLVQELAKEKSFTVFATAREPSASPQLEKLSKENQNVHLIKLNSENNEEELKQAVETVKAKEGGLDYLICNAGTFGHAGPVLTTPLSEYSQHFQVNFVFPVALFQSFYPLLKQRETKTFVYISSALGSISVMQDWENPASPYGASKAAGNYITRKIHLEHEKEGFVVFALSPGWVQTEMGNKFAKEIGAEKAILTIEESVEGQINMITKSTREKEGGRFVGHDGSEYAW
eukprot:TRINITY_DN3645_c0_g1_i1.p1 TRINITY_DN3645_c0_g1~~TRINITY_DN3645_c0_g1_i1.p1  ORF type:complete len:247 (+),score=73.04 TRINITY_DN3645_c0_g1_i1:153-893(+)